MEGELPLARSIELVFRAGYRARRLVNPLQGDSLPEIIISRKMGLICAAIPLCGTRTLKNFFISNRKVHFEAELLRDTVPKILRSKPCGDKPLVFSVVRNPWSRVVSCYEKKIRGAYSKRSYRGYKGILNVAAYEGLSTRMSFDAFVEWLCAAEGRDDVANRHWMSQYRFLSLSEINRDCIKIIRLESMQKGLNCVLADRGLSYQCLEKENSSATTVSGRLHATTKEYYTASAINAIGDRYARDIELFGYDF
jgi:hypothetical protein